MTHAWKHNGFTFFFMVLTIFAASEDGLKTASADEGTVVVIDTAGVNSTSGEWSFYAGTTLEYTDNVFELSESQKSSLENPEEDEVNNGRYKNMEEAADEIVTPVLGLKMEKGSPLGGLFGFDIWLKYNMYVNNVEKCFTETGMTFKQSVNGNGEFKVKWMYLDGYFKKNYLSSVDDANGNGNIPNDERTYSPAVYDELEGILSYRHTLVKSRESLVSRLDVEPFGGTCIRKYNDLFSNRDKRTATGGVGFHFGILSRIGLDLVYKYDRVTSPGDYELVLYDETVDDADVNGDGEIKANAPLLTRIDRSCTRHGVEISPFIDISKKWRFFVGYDWRKSSYSSANTLDMDHYGRTAERNRYKAGVSFKTKESWSVSVEYMKTNEDGPDEDDYGENALRLKVECPL
jgi:hypothetical protein